MINEELWDFPHTTVTKIMGLAEYDLASVLIEILTKNKVTHDVQSLVTQPSKKGTYKSVTCQVTFDNKPQVESVYADYHDAPKIKIFL